MDPIVLSTGPDGAAVLRTVGEALASVGYTVTPAADGWSGRAEVGSKAARALAGGFSRRMILDYQVTQGEAPGTTRVLLTPAMTGWSGGVLGVSKATKEWQSVHGTVGQALHQSGLLTG